MNLTPALETTPSTVTAISPASMFEAKLRRVPLALSAVLLAIPFLLDGCGAGMRANEQNAGSALKQVSGTVFGGQQPITGSTIQLYEVGTTGDASAATAVIGVTVTTSDGTANPSNGNANAGNNFNALPAGSFTIAGDVTCSPTSSEVYIVATGGNPGLSAGSTNSDIALMAALGPCNQLGPSTHIALNELTTVGSIAPVASYMSSYSSLGSGSSDADLLNAALAEVNEYTNTATGTAPGPALPSGYTASTPALEAMADIVGACINSTGGAAGSGGACGLLLKYATPPNGQAPTDTIGAVVNILNNPTNNVPQIFGLLPTTPPYPTTLQSAPASWALPITATGSSQLGIMVQPANSVAGTAISPSITVAIEDASGQTETSATNPVTLSIGANPGTGTLSGTTTVNAINGVATFSNVSINKSGNGYTLVASSSGLTSATSNTFNITAGTATKLVFQGQPLNTPLNTAISPAVTVVVEDANSNVVTSSTAAVSMAIGANPGTGTLSGTTSVNASGGVATFSNLAINAQGNGYTLVANSSGSGLTSATSSTFNVTPAAINVVAQTVGSNFFVQMGVNLPSAAAASENMTLTSSDPTHFLLSTSPTAVGSASITVTLTQGSTNFAAVYLQGQNYSGTTAITGTVTASATGFSNGVGTVTLYPSGIGFYPINSAFSTTAFSSQTQLTVGLLVLNPGTLTLGAQGYLGPQGASPGYTVTSGTTATGTITGNPGTFAVGSTYSQNTYFQPVAAGTSTLTLSQPTGYSIPDLSSGWEQSITATVTAPTISVGAATVGNNFETSYGISLQTAPTSSETLTVTSSDPTHFLLSTNPNAVGTASLTFTICPNCGNPNFYIQGQNYTGTTAINGTITASATGFTTGSNTLTLYPSGIGFYPTPTFSTTTFSSPTQLTIGLLVLNPGTLTIAGQGYLGPQGPSPNYTITSGTPATGTLTGNPGTFTANGSTYSTNVSFQPVNAGTSTLSITEPAGYSTPNPSSGWPLSITATVTAPAINVGAATVGNNFLINYGISLQTAPTSSETLTVTSSDPTHFLLSTSPTTIGSASLTFTICPNCGNPNFYIEGQNYSGTTAITGTITASATGFTTGTNTLSLFPSGIGFYPVTGFSTTTFSSPTTLTVGLLILNPGTLTIAGQGYLGPQGASPNFTITSGTPATGTLTGNPGTYVVNGATYSTNVSFQPVSAGTSILTLSQPPGYSIPAAQSGWLQSITATVTAPAINVYPLTVGNNLVTQLDISLQIAPQAADTFTITTGDPTHFLLSTDPTVLGTASLNIALSAGGSLPAIYVQGQNFNENPTAWTTTLTASANGYATGTTQLSLYPSGIIFYNGASFNTTVSANPTNLQTASAVLNPGTLTVVNLMNVGPQSGKAGVSYTVTSATPATGTITGSPATIGVNNFYTNDISFKPLAVGTSILTINQPSGFDACTTANQPVQITADVTGP